MLEEIFWHTGLPGSDKSKGSLPTIQSPQLIKWSLITDLMSWDPKETKASPTHQSTCAKLFLSMNMKSWADPESWRPVFQETLFLYQVLLWQKPSFVVTNLHLKEQGLVWLLSEQKDFWYPDVPLEHSAPLCCRLGTPASQLRGQVVLSSN